MSIDMTSTIPGAEINYNLTDDYIGELEAGCGAWQRGGKAPFAISRAFLKASGVEYIEVSNEN